MTQLESEDAIALFNQGLEQLQAGNDMAALDYFDNALAINLNEPKIWEKRAVALQNLGRYVEAIASNNMALSFYSDTLKVYDAQGWLNQGNQRYITGNLLGAIAAYEKILEIQPDHYEAWYNRGVVCEKLERYEEALASYNNAIQVKPDYYEAWYNRGVALGNLEQYEQALVSLDKAIEIKPKN